VNTQYATADSMIGLEIHNYRITKQLAAGGMGAVYLAEHVTLPQRRVVKTLLGAYANNDVLRDRFSREAQAAARLKHPHIISIENFGTLPDGQLYLMMPFLDGEPLDAYVHRHGKLPLHRVVYIVLQICAALDHAHQNGLIHRDLKPANIFIGNVDGDRYYITIIDLGISKDTRHPEKGMRTNTGMALGTPYYMPVEQYSSPGSAGPTADVFSVAVIAWELLSGTWPWGAVEDERVLYHKQMSEAPVPTADITPEVAAVLLKALQPEVEERHQTMRAFAVALASATPAIPPFVPSGAEMMRKVSPKLVDDADSVTETIRNNSSHEHLRGPMTPPPSSPRALGHERSDPSIPVVPMHEVVGSEPSVPTVNARPARVTPAVPAAMSPPSRHGPGEPRRRLGVLVAVGCCIVAAIATFAIVHGRSSSETPTPTMVTPAPIAVHAAVAIDAQPASPPADAMRVEVDAALPPIVVRHPVSAPAKKPPPPPAGGSAAVKFDPEAVGGDE